MKKYYLVHQVSKLAKEKVRLDRIGHEEENTQLYRSINKPRETKKPILEAYSEILNAEKNEIDD
ncbi:hypothetical protein IMZ31_23110 (plasmid) [Pontibacillus sp. ALD_SL1]|uniref:hypothetical protein n=1 Tax=Pontibacillus sp. ALD_SL1 TaxID=2777185 RepID=UPI001A9595BE|nr:hypothetical protein [Pontibacillus sp. ALD_SL1]QST02343.1 hypothetical protein IMZ31_23110 [Pontibacillus sp. ALD_SL1]